MTILETKTLAGPNIWSARRGCLIQLLLDLEVLEDHPSSAIPGFYERMVKLMPTLYSHRCSEGKEGGFFNRVKSGTWMGHIVEHIALELQTLAGMDTGFGRTRSAGSRGLYHVVYSYVDAEAGRYAGVCAVQMVLALVHAAPYDLAADMVALKAIWNRNKPGPSTQAILSEAASRGIPCLRLNDSCYYQLGYGARQQRIQASITGRTAAIGVDIAGDKARTKQVLAAARIPVPEGGVAARLQDLEALAESIGFPVVVKPLDGNQGKGVTTNITGREALSMAFRRATQYGGQVIGERHIAGHDFRVLVVNYKVIAVALRKPATVTGDGIHTIRELVDRINRDPLRGDDHDNYLTRILIDDVTLALLKEQAYNPESILPLATVCCLKPTANLSTGGTACDVTDQVHPANKALFERVARLVGLDVCGIDVMADTLGTRLQDNGGAVLEVNAAPGLRMHLHPSAGNPRNVAKPILDMLFPGQTPARIPLFAITGTNGKTTTTRLIAHILSQAGYFVGYTTTDGIYAGEELIEKGDCSGPASATRILQDPAVEVAVLECARGGILRSGLGFDHCDVAVVTNVAEDHLGLQGVNDLEQLARVKAVVATSVSASGTAVLNADDPLVYKMREQVEGKVALFSLSGDSPVIAAHVSKGGNALVVSDGGLIYLQGKERVWIAGLNDIPITFNGAAAFNVANALAATLACLSYGLPLAGIREGLRSFSNCPEQTPGRMNFFQVRGATVLVDYAHNPHGVRAVAHFVSKMQCGKKIGVVGGVGDRRDDDIVAIGMEAALAFDEIIIRQDADLRGRTAAAIRQLVEAGIRRVDPHKRVTAFDTEKDAVLYGLSLLHQDDLLVLLIDNIWQTIGLVQNEIQPWPVRALIAPSVAV